MFGLLLGVLDAVNDALEFACDATEWGVADACYNYKQNKKIEEINEFLESDDGISINDYEDMDSADVKEVRDFGTKEEMEGIEEMEEEVISGTAIEKGYW